MTTRVRANESESDNESESKNEAKSDWENLSQREIEYFYVEG